MNRDELKQIIHETVGSAVANAMGVLQENFDHQFGLINENIQSFRQNAERRFDKIEGNISQMKTVIDTLSIDMVEVKDRLDKLEHREHHEFDRSWRRS